MFGSAYNKKWYDQVIDACCLSQDINSLPDKDMTEIGEKGINLSGGQKARICLARAVYSDKQIYLLDDPLSSVDSHVANHIMNNCFLTVLSKKTRILVTHRLNILDKVDRVIVLDNGTVKEIISPDSLISNSQTQDISETEIQEVNNAQNKLIDEEDRISGKVSLKVYDDYFKFSGGYLAISIGVIAMIL